MNEQEIKTLAKTGFLATTIRQAVVQATGLVTWIVLARWLEPADFGIFSAAGLAVQFFTVFGELSMGLALIRRVEEPREEELNAVFTLQLTVMTVVCALAMALLPFLPRLMPAVTSTGVLLTRVLVLCSWLTAFRLVPSVILTRRLAFTRTAMAEVVENVAFNVAAVVSALAGAGVWSLAIGAVTRSVAGTGMFMYFAPHRFRLRWKFGDIKEIVATGWGFQSFYVISFFKDLTLPAFMVSMLGSVQFGYFVWARDLTFSLLTFSRLFDKVAMPTLARLSATQADVVALLRRSGTLLGLFYWPAAVVLIGGSSFFIPYIFSSKWLPSQPALILLALSLLLQIWLTPMWALVQARSPSRWPLRAVFMLAIFQVSFGYVAIWSNGIEGAAVAMLAVNLLTLLLYRLEMQRLFSGRGSFFPPAASKALINVAVAAGTLWLTWKVQGGFAPALVIACLCALLAVVVNWFMFQEDRVMIMQFAGAAAGAIGKRMPVSSKLAGISTKHAQGTHTCPLCQSDQLRPVVTFRSGASVFHCGGCENGHLWPPPTYTAMDYAGGNVNAAASEADDRLLRFYAADLCAFADGRHALSGKRLLELGCGNGYFLDEALKRNARAEGLEVDPNRRKKCTARGLVVHAHELDAWIATQPQPYDLIILSHVFEHVPDPAHFLRQCRQLLRPGGSICFAQPLHTGFVPRVMGHRWYAWGPTQHYWHFTPNGLSDYLARHGFRAHATRETHLVYHYPALRDLASPRFFAASGMQALAGSLARLVGSHDLFYLDAHAD